MQTYYNELKSILDSIIEKKNSNILSRINIDEWFVAFDVIEAHYLANNQMDYFLQDIEEYIKSVIFWADALDSLDDKTLLTEYAIPSIYHIVDFKELDAIKEEIIERINKVNKVKVKE